MTRLELLNVFLSDKLTAAAQEIFHAVRDMTLDYQSEILRCKQENEKLRRLLGVAVERLLLLQSAAPPSGQSQDSCQPSESDGAETRIKEESEVQDIQAEGCEDGGSSSSSGSSSGSSRLGPAPEPPPPHNKCHAQHLVSPTLLLTQEIKAEDGGDQSGTEQRCPAVAVCSEDGAARRHPCADAGKTHKKTENPEQRVKKSLCSSDRQDVRSRRLKSATRTRTAKLLPPLSSVASNPSQSLQRWHSCRECGKGFSFACQLEVHMRWHTKEKPYSCAVCCKCFTTLSMLKRHHRIHTGEKPFRCHVCGKCFNQSAHLNTHFRLHTRERPSWSQVASK